jgi:ABC-type phosphate transport system ATPase subunit
MGPSVAQSTLLRTINLMHGLYSNKRLMGTIELNGKNILLENN